MFSLLLLLSCCSSSETFLLKNNNYHHHPANTVCDRRDRQSGAVAEDLPPI